MIKCGLIILIMFFVLVGISVTHASESSPIILKEAHNPDLVIFEAAKKVIDEYKDYAKKAWGADVTIKLDKNNGLIYTDWHKVHKGEIEWKIELMVWERLYRIDIWERPSVGIFRYPRKGYMCRLKEMQLQFQIEKILKGETIQ